MFPFVPDGTAARTVDGAIRQGARSRARPSRPDSPSQLVAHNPARTPLWPSASP
jgi:hypothetical protein